MSRVILKQPVAVFDAGIGSFAIARKIADRFPGQDLLYFADRANSPYGGKGRTELLAVMRSTIERLESYGPAAIVIASKCAVSHGPRRSKDLEPDTAGRRVSASTARSTLRARGGSRC